MSKACRCSVWAPVYGTVRVCRRACVSVRACVRVCTRAVASVRKCMCMACASLQAQAQPGVVLRKVLRLEDSLSHASGQLREQKRLADQVSIPASLSQCPLSCLRISEGSKFMLRAVLFALQHNLISTPSTMRSWPDELRPRACTHAQGPPTPLRHTHTQTNADMHTFGSCQFFLQGLPHIHCSLRHI